MSWLILIFEMIPFTFYLLVFLLFLPLLTLLLLLSSFYNFHIKIKYHDENWVILYINDLLRIFAFPPNILFHCLFFCFESVPLRIKCQHFLQILFHCLFFCFKLVPWESSVRMISKKTCHLIKVLADFQLSEEFWYFLKVLIFHFFTRFFKRRSNY